MLCGICNIYMVCRNRMSGIVGRWMTMQVGRNRRARYGVILSAALLDVIMLQCSRPHDRVMVEEDVPCNWLPCSVGREKKAQRRGLDRSTCFRATLYKVPERRRGVFLSRSTDMHDLDCACCSMIWDWRGGSESAGVPTSNISMLTDSSTTKESRCQGCWFSYSAI